MRITRHGGPRAGDRERRARAWIAEWVSLGGKFKFAEDGELLMDLSDIPKPRPERFTDLVLWSIAWPARYKTAARIVREEGLAGC